jgi:competence protein ComEA
MSIKTILTKELSIMLTQHFRYQFVASILLLLSFSVFYASLVHAESIETPTTVSVESTKLNINTANAETLASKMKGIGLRKAEAIVAYRNTYGPFADILELEDVKGIGKKTVEKNAHLIAVK